MELGSKHGTRSFWVDRTTETKTEPYHIFNRDGDIAHLNGGDILQVGLLDLEKPELRGCELGL